MAAGNGIPIEDEIQQLQKFHTKHFPGQSVPAIDVNVTSTTLDDNRLAQNDEQEDDLGYYEDGVRRTLTDDQIAMFRNSEIQRLLAERRRQQEQKREQEEQEQERYEKDQTEDAALWDIKALAGDSSGTNLQYQTRQRFADDMTEETESLVYDDGPTTEENQPGHFVWPKLG